MTCVHCVGAEDFFNEKEARKNLKRYKKKGPNKTTRKLLNALSNENIKGLSLLDIGGGIGAIQVELMKKGLKHTTDVDASQSYINVASQLMKQKGFDNKSNYVHADFTDCHKGIEDHDIVTLEKVVCCYPHVTDLINQSSNKARQFYGLVYPMNGFVFKIVFGILNVYLKFKGNPFRVFNHEEKMIDGLICANGFRRIYYGRSLPWHIALYQRVH
jgi:16S rRNA G966 N2-methylase RsmD